MTDQLDLVKPQLSLGIIEDDQGIEQMIIEINSATIRVTAYLCSKDNYRQVADKLSENIRRLGSEMKTPNKLITNVKELPDGLRKKPQGG